MDNRKLRVSIVRPGNLEYAWRECVKKNLFGNCKEWERKVDYYDLNNPDTRMMLNNMGFIGVVRERIDK